MGANPNHKDLFLELDYMAGQAVTRADIQSVKVAFASAPLDAGGINNPDGQPGINLWVDTGNLVDTTAAETGAGNGSCNDGVDNDGDGLVDGADRETAWSATTSAAATSCRSATSNICKLDANFYNAKRTNFNAIRPWIFRYAISALGCGDIGGQGEIGGNDFVEFNHNGANIMHEFGHNLNLRHGGNVNANCKPNFVSVMNYDHSGFGIDRVGGGTILDYSPPRIAANGSTRGTTSLPTLVENNLNEATILDGTDIANQFVFTNGTGNKVRNSLNAQPDWNGDGDTNDASLTVNIDTNDTNTGSAAWLRQ